MPTNPTCSCHLHRKRPSPVPPPSHPPHQQPHSRRNHHQEPIWRHERRTIRATQSEPQRGAQSRDATQLPERTRRSVEREIPPFPRTGHRLIRYTHINHATYRAASTRPISTDIAHPDMMPHAPPPPRHAQQDEPQEKPMHKPASDHANILTWITIPAPTLTIEFRKMRLHYRARPLANGAGACFNGCHASTRSSRGSMQFDTRYFLASFPRFPPVPTSELIR